MNIDENIFRMPIYPMLKKTSILHIFKGREGREGRGGRGRGGDNNTKNNRVLTRKEPTNLDFRVFSANSIKCTLLCVHTKYIQFKVHLMLF